MKCGNKCALLYPEIVVTDQLFLIKRIAVLEIAFRNFEKRAPVLESRPGVLSLFLKQKRANTLEGLYLVSLCLLTQNTNPKRSHSFDIQSTLLENWDFEH